MKKYFLIIFLIYCSVGFSQNISIGIRKSIYSKTLNENRELLIYTPKELNNESVYPVIYLLDGDNNFHVTTGIVEFLSKSQFCPEMIIVGISNTKRNRDFTPTNMSNWKGSGGAEIFTTFLTNELMPNIDSTYPTAKYKILIGHSLGGLYALNTLIKSPDIFNAYIVIDPSVWWDNGFLIKQINEFSKKHNFSDETIYFSSGFPNTGLDSTQLRNDTTEITQNIRAKFEFCDILDSLRNNNRIDFNCRIYKREVHSTIPLISINDGIRYIFDFYKPPVIDNNKDSLDIAKDIILNHYKNVSDKIGFTVLPPDNLIETVLYLYHLNNMHDRMNDIQSLKDLKKY